jgi:cell division protein FtsQ
VYPQEILADEEPKYLRRQKPLEIKRRKFGKRAWKTYLVVSAWTFVGLAGCGLAYEGARFLLVSPRMELIHPEQIELTGNHNVDRSSVVQIFTPDRGRSVLRIPLDRRRQLIEEIPWVEHAVVRRSLPNHIEVQITERAPVAFLRDGNDLALLDAHGVILDRPISGDFHFPVVTGVDEAMPQDDRELRMQLFSGFTQQIQAAHPGALDQVSEVDLSDAHDVRATISGLLGPAASNADSNELSSDVAAAPVLVHFGDGDFAGKYQTLIENIAQWHATAGRIRSVDLRFSREAVVNADTASGAASDASHKSKPATAPAGH